MTLSLPPVRLPANIMQTALFACALALPLAVGLPQIAAAQVMEFSPDGTESCLTEGGEETCVGESSRFCMDGNVDGNTTFGMVDCMSQEYSYWDERLNAAYQLLVAQNRDEDAAQGEDSPGYEEALRAMQRAWVDLRDATCFFEGLDMYGGTGEGLVRTDCLLRMTGQRALELERRGGFVVGDY